MRYIVSAMLIVAGVIHLLPITGAIGGEKFTALYGISVGEPNVAILMRHRTVLFGLLGAFLVIAAFKPLWQGAALVASSVSVVSFLWLAKSVGGYNAQLARVVTADVVAAICLVIAITAFAYIHSKK